MVFHIRLWIQKKCVDCGICERVCPVISKSENNETTQSIIAYAAYTKNEETRKAVRQAVYLVKLPFLC